MLLGHVLHRPAAGGRQPARRGRGPGVPEPHDDQPAVRRPERSATAATGGVRHLGHRERSAERDPPGGHRARRVRADRRAGRTDHRRPVRFPAAAGRGRRRRRPAGPGHVRGGHRRRRRHRHVRRGGGRRAARRGRDRGPVAVHAVRAGPPGRAGPARLRGHHGARARHRGSGPDPGRGGRDGRLPPGAPPQRRSPPSRSRLGRGPGRPGRRAGRRGRDRPAAGAGTGARAGPRCRSGRCSPARCWP